MKVRQTLIGKEALALLAALLLLQLAATAALGIPMFSPPKAC